MSNVAIGLGMAAIFAAITIFMAWRVPEQHKDEQNKSGDKKD